MTVRVPELSASFCISEETETSASIERDRMSMISDMGFSAPGLLSSALTVSKRRARGGEAADASAVTRMMGWCGGSPWRVS